MYTREAVIFWTTFLLSIFVSIFGVFTENFVAPVSEDLPQLIETFAKTHDPKASLDFIALTSVLASSELKTVDLFLPHYHLYDAQEISSLLRFAKTCDFKDRPTHDLKKAFQWQKFICGQSPLPARFFSTPPLIHPSGKSFVQLAIETQHPEFAGEWKKNHSQFQTLLERLPIPINNLSHLQDLLNQQPVVVTSSGVFIADTHAQEMFYRQFSVGEFTEFLKKNHWDQETRELCSVTYGNLCLRAARTNPYHKWIFVLQCLAWGSVCGIGVFEALKRWKSKRAEEQKRNFTLQVLTHELRTPVTTLQLALHSLRSNFDALDDGGQKSFLRACDQVNRLQKTTDASTRWLQSDLAILPQAVLVKDLLNCLNDEFEGELEIPQIAKSLQIESDPFWLHFCLKNLLSNAFAHGKKPVKITIEASENLVTIAVQDSGHVKFSSLQEMAQPFTTTRGPQGLGLGLALVKKISESLQMEFSFAASPTTFSLRVKRLI